MHRIEAELEIVTPMFLGGADPRGSAELRAASIKGALRFWWRALAWGRLGGDLEAIHKAEQRIFGSSEKSVGQGAFLLRIVEQDLRQVKRAGVRLIDSDNRTVLPGARYLGYGLMKAFGTNLGTLERGCIQTGNFQLELLFRPVRNQELTQQGQDFASVLAALQAFGLLGGLGARTRRGWGSVALRQLKVDRGWLADGSWELPESPTTYAAAVQGCLGGDMKGSGKEPPFTAFADATRIELPQPSPDLCKELAINRDRTTALQCLAAVGSAMLLYRSWGRGGKVRLVDSSPPRDITTSKTFEDDHDWYKWFADGADPKKRPAGLTADFHPERIVFGLPHNYRGVDVNGVDADRRGSPLFIHIHRTKAGQHFAAISVLPALFLPNVQPRTDAERRDLKAKRFEATREFSKKREDGSEAKYHRQVKASQNIAMVGENACSCVADQVEWDHLYKLLESAGFDQDPARKIVVLGGVAP